MADVNTTISSALEKTIPFVAKFGNTKFIHQLTPKSVHKKVKKTSKPRFRVDFELSGRYIQNGLLWSWKGVGTVGIQKGNLKFPKKCVHCLKPVTHYELFEIVDETPVDGESKLRLEETDFYKKNSEDIWNAILRNRYWYPIPFCEEHNMDSGAFIYQHSEGSQKREWIGFANYEYGEEFAKINNLDGGWWDSKTQILNSIYNVVFGIAVCLGLATGIFITGALTINGVPYGYEYRVYSGAGTILFGITAYLLRHFRNKNIKDFDPKTLEKK